MKSWLAAACLAALVGLMLAVSARTQEKKEPVYRTVSSEAVEKILDGMNIRYKKTSAKGSDFYDFERNNFKIRLRNSGGKDLGIDAAFPKVPLERINEWNVRAKFSRAVLATVGDRETCLVEAQLDCGPGVTDAIIRQFVNRFDTEVRDFDRFLSR
jgi:hypothetical protein